MVVKILGLITNRKKISKQSKITKFKNKIVEKNLELTTNRKN